jgi:hypothetical protein
MWNPGLCSANGRRLPDFEIAYRMRLSPDFHSRGELTNPAETAPGQLSEAESCAPPAFCAKGLCRTAQNPVTGLWMGCSRLKINQIEVGAFC